MGKFHELKEMIKRWKDDPMMLKELRKTVAERARLNELSSEEAEVLFEIIDKFLGQKGEGKERKEKATATEEPKCEECEIECIRKKEMEALTGQNEKSLFAKIIRSRLYKTGIVEAVDWEENVADWIEACREAGGVVMFRTRYAGKRFEDPEHPGRYLVLGICYSPEKPCPSTWFKNVPEEDVERLEMD